MAITVDAVDKELLQKVERHVYFSPRFIDDRKRLDRLAELGLVSREEPAYSDGEQGPRYRLTPLGKKCLSEGI